MNEIQTRAVAERLSDRFTDLYGAEARSRARLFFAPGRVNLIGEHTDYNGGHVFPCAISLGIWAMVAPSEAAETRLHSMNLDEHASCVVQPGCWVYDPARDWANYPLGVIQTLREHGYLSGALDAVFWGDLPNGAGLSSSAAIEVVTGLACDSLFGFELERIDLALMCQKAENRFIGMNCGIMDQFAVAMGREKCAILLDCETLQHRYVPLELGSCCLVLANANKQHKLSDSAYNERRNSCEEALEDMRTARPVVSLGSLSLGEFEELSPHIVSPVNFRRARHAVTENQRTLQAVELLECGDLNAFGRLMRASHESLRDDYEVTGPELDALAELAWSQSGVVGARMTGAGFGGCTVNIVKGEAVKAFCSEVGAGYKKRTGREASFYVAESGPGAREVPFA
ncbi:MAG: galactokinase [Fretibacterium sp.]|nr:galactokinase [Fretibacterium sp.]